jgi:hypothetical protein
MLNSRADCLELGTANRRAPGVRPVAAGQMADVLVVVGRVANKSIISCFLVLLAS